MNILASLDWIKEYIDTDLSAEEIASRLSLVGNEVEKKVRPADRLEKVVVGRVQELKEHPNADKLKLVMADVGNDQVVQIVCGIVGLEVGQLVPVALPGAVVMWHGTDEVTLEVTKVRGEESYGMICVPDEIGFVKLADGANVWTLDGLVEEGITTGTPLAEALKMDKEIIFDIEVTTNRPDTMAIVGLAREASAADLGTMEDPMMKPVQIEEGEGDVFTVKMNDDKLCPRYMALMLDVEVAPSPWWMQKRILLAGGRPINNVVDVTNYVRLEYGQPLHAFDHAKLAGGEIVVRRASAGESFEALDASVHSLKEDMLVIADKMQPVAVAGVMGGLNSGVDDSTKRIVLEAATFDEFSVRKTARTLNLYSDAQQLYEKGLSTELPAHAMQRAIELLKEVANAKVVSKLADVRASAYEPRKFLLDPKRVNALIGIDIDTERQTKMLERLGCVLEPTDSTYNVTVPFWRDHDIEDSVDFTEEVARLYGYANMPSEMPHGAIPRRERDTLLDRENELKDLLVGAGYTEFYSNSFIDPADVARCQMDASFMLGVKNPLSQEEALMRSSLLPSMLKSVAANQESDVNTFFELQKVYLKREGDLPEERSMLMVGVRHTEGGEGLYQQLRGTLEHLLDHYHISYTLDREPLPSQLHPGRAASVSIDGTVVGTFGELHPTVQENFGIDDYVGIIEIDVVAVEPFMKLSPTYQEAPAFPPVLRDLALVVDESTAYGDLESAISSSSKLLRSVELFDLFRDEKLGAGKKSLAMHLAFRADDRTLTSEEIDAEMAAITASLEGQFGAEVRA